jgi:hypothetical protein
MASREMPSPARHFYVLKNFISYDQQALAAFALC